MNAIVWTDPALADLQAIVDYISRDSDVYAAAMAERIVGAVDRLGEHPKSGRAVREARSAGIREIVVAPYRVMYRARTGMVEILAIVHGARDHGRMRPRPWKR